MSKECDRYFVMYASLISLLESDDEDEPLFDEFDEILAHAMLIEMSRRSL